MDATFSLVTGARNLPRFFKGDQHAPHTCTNHGALALISSRRHVIDDLPHLEPAPREGGHQIDHFVRILHSNILHTCCLKLPSATL
ncbi:hypothetical protein D3C86_1600330 [compost metagenome]